MRKCDEKSLRGILGAHQIFNQREVCRSGIPTARWRRVLSFFELASPETVAVIRQHATAEEYLVAASCKRLLANHRRLGEPLSAITWATTDKSPTACAANSSLPRRELIHHALPVDANPTVESRRAKQ
jgi:hypothetical protein